ncbi:MAG: Ig-like domain-containing protein, partial [Patescibacteria group bacterium]
MKHSQKTFFAFLALGVIAGAALFAFAHVAQALTVENVGGTLTLGDADLKQTVINVIKWALGLLGLVAVIIMLYGGFLWLTSRGDEKQIDKAKRTLINGAIGIVIILVAWAIVLFVQRFITGSTGTANAASCGPNVGIGFGQYGCNDCVDSAPVGDGEGILVPNPAYCQVPPPADYWQSTSQVPPRPTENVKLCTTPTETFGGLRDEDGDSTPDENNAATGEYTVEPLTDFGGAVSGPGIVGVTNRTISQSAEFMHIGADFARNTVYRVTHNTFSSATGALLTLPAQSWEFKTGEETDQEPPTVDAVLPDNGDTIQCLMPELHVRFSEAMLASSMHVDNVRVVVTPAPPTPVELTSITHWPGMLGFTANFGQALPANSTVTITLDSREDTILQPGSHGGQYLPGLKDACVNALDGDGDTNSEGPPQDNYSWTFTIGNTTQVACDPKITNIESPVFYGNNGADALQSVTISGENFGLNPTVHFTGIGVIANNIGGPTSSCFDANFRPKQNNSEQCILNSNNSTIQTLVPAGHTPSANASLSASSGAVDGSVVVQTGKYSPPSTPIDVQSPHIDWANPPDGKEGTFVTIHGSHFGNNAGTVYFRKADGSSAVSAPIPACAGASGWTDTEIVVQVPAGFAVAELADIQVRNISLPEPRGRSNLFRFTINNVEHPGLCFIDPVCHASSGQELVATGEGFGSDINQLQGLYNAFGDAGKNFVSPGVVRFSAPDTLPNNSYNFAVRVGTRVTNPRSYRIPCDPPPQVVESASCSATQVPSPNPRPNSTDMCRNSIIQAEFNVDMNVGTLIAANMQVQDCGANPTFDGSSCANIAGDVTAPSDRIIQFAPDAALLGNHWYQVTIGRGVQNVGLANMNQDYVWHFRVRDSAENCTAQMVTVQPSNWPMLTGDSNNFQAQAMLNNCNLLDTDANFSWATSNVVLTNNVIPLGPGGSFGRITIQPPTPGETDLTAVLTAQADGKQGQAIVTVRRGACETNADCTAGGTMCAGSICQEVSPGNKRCTPSITSMTNTGPAGNLVTIDGCYFGAYKGSGTVRFDVNETVDPSAVEGNFAMCGPGAWTDTQITVAHEPKDAVTGSVWKAQVQPDGAGVNPSPWFTGYTVAGLCQTNTGAMVPVPADGVPQLCGISPSIAKASQQITYTGARFNPSNGDPTNDSRVFFQQTAAGVPPWTPAQSSGTFSTTMGTGVVAGNAVYSPGRTVVGKPVTGAPGLYCLSNHKDFTLRCDTNAECASGCCSGNQCAPNLNACTDSLVDSVDPDSGTLSCRNASFTITFTPDMQGSTLTTANIKLRLSPGGAEIPTDLHIMGSKVVRLNPKTPIARNSVVEVIIRGSQIGVLSVDGKFMGGDWIAGPVQVAADATICTVNRVAVVRYFNTPITEDLFGCSGNNCSGDIDGANGNQLGYFAVALSTGGEILTAESQVWTEADTGGTPGQTNTYTGGLDAGLCRGAATGPDQVYCATALNVANGTENLTVQVTAANNAGTGTATFPIRSFMCANPWPAPPNYPFRDSIFNFETSFCRDSLPDYTL